MASNFQWLYFAHVGGFCMLINFHCKFRFYLDFARVGGSHVQGTYGQSYSELCFAINNTADGSLRRARRVKIDEK